MRGERTLSAVFLNAVAGHPQRRFMRWVAGDREMEWSYEQAARRVAVVASALEARLERGERVLCYLEDVLPSAVFMIAAAFRGAVFVPVAPEASDHLLTGLRERLGMSFAFTTKAHAEKLRALGFDVAVADADFPVVAEIPAERSLGTDAALKLLRRLSSECGEDDVYFIQPTSGTTGEPKLIERFQRPFLRTAGHLSSDWGRTRDDEPPERCLLAQTLTHGAGHQFLWTPLSLAAELSAPGSWGTETSLADVRKLDPTRIFVPPRVLRALHREWQDEQPEPKERFLGPGLKSLMVGGSSCEIELLRCVAEQGVDVIENYGSTEAGDLLRTPPGQWREGWAGVALPHVEIRLDADGELLVKSPVQMRGYLDQPDLTRDVITEDGFYRTGDYVEVDSEGWIRILGRKRDLFNTADGANIYPARIETQVESLPWVRQVVVVGDQKPFVVALIVCEDAVDGDDGYARAQRDLRDANRSLEPNERVRRFALLDSAFAEDAYGAAGFGKTRRNRRLIADRYRSVIEGLYGDSASASSIVEESE